jgi:integrase
MVTRDGKQLARGSKETCQIAKPEAKPKVSPLRQRMIRDRALAGFTPGTQQTYIGAVVKLHDHYAIRPDRLLEKQVQRSVLWLRDDKRVAKGTFQTTWYGLKFLYSRTLGVDWALFTRKKVRQPRRKRLPVAIAWEDGHRLIAALQKPSYRPCCSVMLAWGLRIGDVLALTVPSIDSTQRIVRVIAKETRNGFCRCRRHCSWPCIPSGPPTVIRVCFSPTAMVQHRSARSRYAAPSLRPAIRSASTRTLRLILCVTGLRRICWKTASTSVLSKCCSATPASARHRSTRT